MASPTTVAIGDDYEPALVEVTTTVSEITIDSDKQYILVHTGLGEDAAEHTAYIMCATGSKTAAATAGDGQFLLIYGQSQTVGPGISTLKLDATTDDPLVNITPVYNSFGAH